MASDLDPRTTPEPQPTGALLVLFREGCVSETARAAIEQRIGRKPACSSGYVGHAAQLSHLLGRLLPGRHGLSNAWRVDFRRPLYVGQQAEIEAEIVHRSEATGTLRIKYEKRWWELYGHYDVWSDLFRHFSSTCFNDKQWDEFIANVAKLTPEEFYKVLRSEYDKQIVAKMFPYKLVPHYFKHVARQTSDFILRRMTLRQATSWIE